MNAPSFLNCRRSSDGDSTPGELSDSTRAQSKAIEELRRWEAGAILRRRHFAGVSSESPPSANTSAPPPDDLIGLALSGGGVRSAAFNLGFLQALSESGFLRYVDYLCSVSGGGYIAGHLSALASLPQPTGESEPASPFHGSKAARLGLDDRQKLNSCGYRFRHMGDYLTDYVGIIWRYVVFTIPLLFWAACLLGVLATIAALIWRLCDLPPVRAYFDLVGLNRLGTALHIGNEMPYALLPSIVCLGFMVLSVVALLSAPASMKRTLQPITYGATILWLISLGISIAVFLGNAESALGASSQLQEIQSHITWPLLLLTLLSFLPLLVGRTQLMQSGREHAPPWKKLMFRMLIGGASVCAAFLMVHLMARENISGYATHRDSTLVPADIYDWNAFLGLLDGKQGGPLASAFESQVASEKQADFAKGVQDLRGQDHKLRDSREQIAGRTSWEQWERVPLIHLYEGTMRLWSLHFGGPNNARTYLTDWTKLREAQESFLNDFVNPALEEADPNVTPVDEPQRGGATLTNRLLQLAVYCADADADKRDGAKPAPSSVIAGLIQFLGADTDADKRDGTNPAPAEGNSAKKPADATPTVVASNAQPVVDGLGIEERRKLEAFIESRAKQMREGEVFADLARRYLLHMTHGSEQPGEAGKAVRFTAAERGRFNRLLLECLFPKIIRERTMVSTTIVPAKDQLYRVWWLGFWLAGFWLVGLLVDVNRWSPFYNYYRDRLDDYFVQTAPQAADAAAAAAHEPPAIRPANWDLLWNLKPWERGAPYPLMLGSAFFFNKVGVVPPPAKGSAAGDAFKQHSFLFSPLYCGTAVAGYQRTDKYCGGDLRLCEAMAMSGAALTPFMIDNVWFAGLMAAFNFRIGQWLPRPTELPGNNIGQRCGARPLGLLNELCRSHNPTAYSDRWQMALVADGGFHDFFGLEELLVRRCKLIIVSDAGCNNDQYEFGALADVIRLARERHGIDIVDLDDDQAADLCGLRRIAGENRQQLYHTCLRILYPRQPGETGPREGLLVYAQMSLTGREQIDLQQFRKTHPNFPDEPITNQFFSHGQIESYRQLGFHIGNAVCRDVHARPHDRNPRPTRQTIGDDLVRGYLQEYYSHVHCARPAGHKRPVEVDQQDAVATAADQGECSGAELEATSVLGGWRSQWFKANHAPESDPILYYERHARLRQQMLKDVAALLESPQLLPIRAKVLHRNKLVHMLLACHEHNAGTVESRFLPGGRQYLRRAAPRLGQLLRGSVEGLAEFQPPVVDRGDWLLNLAWSVFNDLGPATAADFMFCLMRSHGIPLRGPWDLRGAEVAYRNALREALAVRDVDRTRRLCAHWKLTDLAHDLVAVP